MVYKQRHMRQNTFTLEELKKYNGKNNMPSYVAVDGIVYDVSSIPSWAKGNHFGILAGKDLSKEFQSCHPGELELLKKLAPVVGTLKTN